MQYINLKINCHTIYQGADNMSVQSRQALRLLKFVAEMKKHNYPNAQSFAELLRKIDLEEGGH